MHSWLCSYADGLGYADDGEEHFSSGGESGVDDDDDEGVGDGDEAVAEAEQRRKRKRAASSSAAPTFQPLGAMLSRTTTGVAAKASKETTAAGKEKLQVPYLCARII
jgi:hypothetical protein